MKVLIGASNIIKNKKTEAIQFEFNSMNIFSQNTLTDFIEFSSNYNLLRILPGVKLLRLNKNEIFTRELFAYQNIVCRL